MDLTPAAESLPVVMLGLALLALVVERGVAEWRWSRERREMLDRVQSRDVHEFLDVQDRRQAAIELAAERAKPDEWPPDPVANPGVYGYQAIKRTGREDEFRCFTRVGPPIEEFEVKSLADLAGALGPGP